MMNKDKYKLTELRSDILKDFNTNEQFIYIFDKDGNRIHEFVTPIDCGCVFSKLFEWLEKE